MSKSARQKKKKAQLLKALKTKMAGLLENATSVPCPELGSDCLFIKNPVKNKSGYVLLWARALGFESPACCHVIVKMLDEGFEHKSEIPRDRNPNNLIGRKHCDHLCAQFATTEAERRQCRACCNPLHLRFITYKQNIDAIPEAARVYGASIARTFTKGVGRPPVMATCCPTKKHYAFSYCNSCYKRLPHVRAKSKAYRLRKMATDPVYVERVNATHRVWYEATKDRRRAVQKAWRDRKKTEALDAQQAA